MNQFHILAHGHTFDVSAFLANSSLRPSHKWKQGERSHAMVRAITDGFIIRLSDNAEIDFQSQQVRALAFVLENEDELRRCKTFRGVDYFLLSLRFILPVSDSTFGFATFIDFELLTACVKVGLNPSVFVQFDRNQETA